MLWSMGLKHHTIFNETAIQEKIEFIDSRFHLVMITEMMDESLVLMAHLLCIPLHEVAMFAKNVRKEGHKRVTLSEQTKNILRYTFIFYWDSFYCKDRFRRVQSGDEKLYHHFKKKLEEKIEEFGREKMRKSVEELQRLRKIVEESCILDGHLNTGAGDEIWNKRVVAVNVKDEIEECRLMQMSEINLVKVVRAHQRAYFKYRFGIS